MEPPTSGRRLHANSTPCELMSSVKPASLKPVEPACVIDNGSRILKRVPFRWSPERPRMLSSMVAQPEAAYDPSGASVTVGKIIHLCRPPPSRSAGLDPAHDLGLGAQLPFDGIEPHAPAPGDGPEADLSSI